MLYLKKMACTLFVFLCACSSAPQNQEFGSQVERAFGKENYAFFEAAEKITVMKVEREGKDGYTVVSQEKTLAPAEVAKLREYLLSDSSYQFERRKKCVFVPDYAFKFQDKNKEIVMLVSFSCPQIKVLLNNHVIIIDHDPISAEMEALTQSIMNK
jgi:hypothetical protein